MKNINNMEILVSKAFVGKYLNQFSNISLNIEMVWPTGLPLLIQSNRPWLNSDQFSTGLKTSKQNMNNNFDDDYEDYPNIEVGCAGDASNWLCLYSVWTPPHSLILNVLGNIIAFMISITKSMPSLIVFSRVLYVLPIILTNVLTVLTPSAPSAANL